VERRRHGGGHRGANAGGGRHWNGGHHGHHGYRGHGHRHGHYHGGRYWYGGYYPYWGWGWAWGLPLYASAYYAWPYYAYGYSDYYYPPAYAPEYAPIPEGRLVPAPSTEVPPLTEGAPGQGPLYMNYCESAKAYFPKVTTCPEGWKFIAPTS
jgi:hypothetical protein